MWLRDCLACTLPGVRVLLYGYDTVLVKSESFQDIDDIGTNLSLSIRSIRRAYQVRREQIQEIRP